MWAALYAPDNLEVYAGDSVKLEKVLGIVREKAKVFADYEADMTYFYKTPEQREDLMINEKMKLDLDLAKTVLNEVAIMLQEVPEDDFNAVKIREVSIEKIAEMELKNGQFSVAFPGSAFGLRALSGAF